MTVQSVRMSGGTLDLTYDELGIGPPLLLLHGGAGSASMRPLFGAFPDHRVVLVTYPGFDGTERPDWFSSIGGLAEAYLAFLDAKALKDVVIVGNSAGGWVAAEIATRQPASIGGAVLVDAVGLQPDGATGGIGDPRAMPFQELIGRSFADPSRAPRLDPSAMRLIEANQQALMAYAGDPFMHDPTLAGRLADITMPSLLLWGEKDGIVTPAYGKQYAALIPGARFELIEDAGHLPQIEQPAKTVQAIQAFCAGVA